MTRPGGGNGGWRMVTEEWMALGLGLWMQLGLGMRSGRER